MWGQEILLCHCRNNFGIIPTRVGTRDKLPFIMINGKDHPHACGDKLYKSLHCPADTGSSPRVWGQVGLDIWYQFDNRIIPTRVGTRLGIGRTALIAWDHPHACGDKGNNSNRLLAGQGSSPRVWGQVAVKIWEKYGLGIIPTRVGTRTCYPC